MPTITLRDIATSSSVLTPRETIVEKIPPSIGPIPLAAFIPMVFFAPFIISFALWITYCYTIKRCKQKRRAKNDALNKNLEADMSRDVEMQVAGFVKAPPPAKTRLYKERAGGKLETVQEEKDGAEGRAWL